MSSIKLVILALASSAVATRHGHAYGHQHLHERAGTGAPSYATASVVPYPYPNANGTRVWGTTGLSLPTGYGLPSSSSASSAAAADDDVRSTADSEPTGYGSSSSAADATDAVRGTLHSTIYSTVTVLVNNRVAASSAAADAQSGDSCAVVTVTYTERVTATVTEGQSTPSSTDASPVSSSSAVFAAEVRPSASSDASSVGSTSAAPTSEVRSSASSDISPVETIAAAPAYSAWTNSSSSSPELASNRSSSATASSSSVASTVELRASASAYSAPTTSSSSIETADTRLASDLASSTSEASPVTTSIEVSSSSSSASDGLTISAYGANKQVASAAADLASSSTIAAADLASSSTTASAAASSSSSSSSSAGKRGLAYNDASLTTCFSSSREVSWAYNWGSSSDGLSSDYTFIPTLWGTGSEFVDSWSENAKAAIASGSTHLFSFNEPDLAAQANLGYAAAATAYAQYMNPFKGQAQLCAPAVTNGADPMGLTWLKNFLDACTDCQIDCLNIHWYDSASNTAYFKSYVEEAIALANGKPLYISEFGATGSDAEIASFLEEVMPWMDSNSNIGGYAYFMVSDGMLVTGTEPSTYGNTFMSFTS